ncbi:hypothetical protein JXR01_00150 [Candidatus Kaiserbacteria bacterium]|nr:MAG: hypothetical protein JXR01_00150 [Candidatus Kaiserbacteria bacterium]
MNAKDNNVTTAKNIFAILGFIILLAIGVWSAIQVITFVPRLFSDTGVTSSTAANIDLGDKDIVVELSKDVANSGDSVDLTFAHTGDETGVLSFSYACKEGFYFQIADRPVPCNAPYSLPTTDTTLKVIPVSANELTDVAIAVTYTNSTGESVRDTKSLQVVNTSPVVIDVENESDEDTSVETETTQADDVTTTTAETDTSTSGPREATSVVPTQYNTPYTYTYVPQASNPYGSVDLEVQMVAIGDINAYGSFEAKGILRTYSTGGAMFRVTNRGTKQSGNWYFSAMLPTRGGYPFNSDAQRTLMPNESVEIFMTFDQLIPGTHTFSVQVDESNYIYESNEYNNAARQTITVLGY